MKTRALRVLRRALGAAGLLLCLGLAGAFVFDLYVHSDAMLFGKLDADAVSIRGLVHALVMPLVWLCAARNRDWARRVRLSRKIVVHTTGLLAVGAYLLFMAAVGYYVRFFGGEWGRAFQLALVFAEIAPVLRGGWIQKIHQPQVRTIVLDIRVPGETHRLLISCDQNNARLHLTTGSHLNPPTPPPATTTAGS